MMRNLAVLLLLLAVCAVALSTGLRERRSYSDEDGDKAALEALLQAIDKRKVDANELLANRESNPSRRISDEDGSKLASALQALLQDIEEGKVDVNELLANKESNPSRRLWFPFRFRIGKK